MTLLTVALLLFVAAALGGVAVWRSHAREARPPKSLAVGHPLLAASGLLLLGASYVRAGGSVTLAAALVVLAVTAAAGIGLAYLRVRRGRAPTTFIAAHALLALCGIALIVAELFGAAENVPPPL